MRCPRCDREYVEGTKFCGECGTALTGQCFSCGAANPPTNKFCSECGRSLAGTAARQNFGSPDTYTPKHLAEKNLTSKSARVEVLVGGVVADQEARQRRAPRLAAGKLNGLPAGGMP